jgi:hypothetical protein
MDLMIAGRNAALAPGAHVSERYVAFECLPEVELDFFGTGRAK